jgi:hypothetical protein
MKNKVFLIAAILLQFSFSSIFAQDVTTVEAKSDEISYNLDLEAVASIFGDSKDLEDFEKRLNNPEFQISNLDLNNDGVVDYLRVIETRGENVNLITIQAVLEKDIFQDVATIDVVLDEKGTTKVQVVGDVYMYGENYIIEPVYVRQPVFFVYFWDPYYSPWHSPYYYGYYPTYYSPWRPYPVSRYRRNVHVHVNVRNSYSHTEVRRSRATVELQREVRRNDYAKRNPDKSFVKRNVGLENKNDLIKSRKFEDRKTEDVKIVKPNNENTRVINRKEETRSAKPSVEMNNRRTPAPSSEVKAPSSKVESKSSGSVERNSRSSAPKNAPQKSVAPSKPQPAPKRDAPVKKDTEK